MDNRRKIRRDLVPIVSDYANTFCSDSGLRVLADLEASYGGECYVKGDLQETLYRSYSRDVLERIKTMIKLSGLEVEEDEPQEGDYA